MVLTNKVKSGLASAFIAGSAALSSGLTVHAEELDGVTNSVTNSVKDIVNVITPIAWAVVILVIVIMGCVLLWGAVQSEDLAFYRVYRAEAPGLAGGEGTLIGEAQPEKYIVGRWVDEGLKDDAVYYYRVRAVAKDGREGPLSEEIAVHTLQP